jgi:hypothetical protein
MSGRSYSDGMYGSWYMTAIESTEVYPMTDGYGEHVLQSTGTDSPANDLDTGADADAGEAHSVQSVEKVRIAILLYYCLSCFIIAHASAPLLCFITLLHVIVSTADQGRER